MSGDKVVVCPYGLSARKTTYFTSIVFSFPGLKLLGNSVQSALKIYQMYAPRLMVVMGTMGVLWLTKQEKHSFKPTSFSKTDLFWTYEAPIAMDYHGERSAAASRGFGYLWPFKSVRKASDVDHSGET